MSRVISVADFKERIKAGNGRVDEDLTITEQVIIKEGQLNVQHYDFKGIRFAKGLVFANIGDVKAGIRFINCTCTGHTIQISGCHVSTPSSDFELPYGSGLIIENCQFTQVQILNNPDFSRGVHIRKNSTLDSLEINESSFKMASIHIEGSTIIDKLDLNHIKTKQGLRFDNSNINCKVRIFDAIGGSFVCLKTKFEKGIHIHDCELGFRSNNSIFEDDVYIKGNKIDEFVSIGDDFKKSLKQSVFDDQFKNGYLKSVYIQNTKSGEGFVFKGDLAILEKLQISATNLLNGTFKFNNFKITETLISGLNLYGNIIFQRSTFKDLSFADFHNKGGLTLANCSGNKGESSLKINESHLGNAVFLSFDFASFKSITIESSVLHDIELSNPNLPKPEQLTLLNEDVGNFETRKREIYRQLRHAVSKKGDSILSTELHAEELKLFRKEKQELSFFDRDRIMLWFSSSNDMGMNWSKPLWWLLGISILFYFPILICANDQLELSNLSNFNQIDWWASFLIYWDNLYLILRLLNPTRIISKIIEEPDSNWIYLWDTMHKLILAFLTFQIVSAFRKYLK